MTYYLFRDRQPLLTSEDMPADHQIQNGDYLYLGDEDRWGQVVIVRRITRVLWVDLEDVPKELQLWRMLL